MAAYKLFSRVVCFTWLAFAGVASASLIPDPAREYSVQINATALTSPARIRLSWDQDLLALPLGYTVYRKAIDSTSWQEVANLIGLTTSWTDSNVSSGSAYEYQVVKAGVGYTGYGYIYAGIDAPLIEQRGKLILLVDNTHAAALSAELNRLERDLTGDGWTVIRRDVSRNDSPASVKSVIKAEYNADPDPQSGLKAVFLFGRVPVFRSGNLNVDGHQSRAMPADAYYADMDGAWDSSTSYLPSDVELQIGRVDLSNMPGNVAWNGPSTFPSEVALLRQYLNKNHEFRHAITTVPRRALIGDRFGVFSGQAFAASGWRNFAPFVGTDNITASNVEDVAPSSSRWISYLTSNSYLWAYGCGGGSETSMSGLGHHGLYSDVWSLDVAGYNEQGAVVPDNKAVFTMLFGSWLGDWDTRDNLMRSVLAARSAGLTAVWSGRPHWFFHHMALGQNIGYSTRLTQNNPSGGLYRNQSNPHTRGVHIALMGDPTLRMHPVKPPGNVQAQVNGNSVSITWSPSADSNLRGYHVYRASDSDGPFTRLTGAPVAGTSFTDNSAPGGSPAYMVRAVKLESTPSGTYLNPSQGAFASVATGFPPAPVISSLQRQANGQVQLQITGQPGQTCEIHYSNDLDNWSTLTTVNNSSGTVSVTDTSANGASRRFYRAMVR